MLSAVLRLKRKPAELHATQLGSMLLRSLQGVHDCLCRWPFARLLLPAGVYEVSYILRAVLGTPASTCFKQSALHVQLSRQT